MRILYLPSSKCQQRQFEKPKFYAYPVHLAMEAEYYRQHGENVTWGQDNDLMGVYMVVTEPGSVPFLSLPHPDRKFTNAFDPRYQDNGNFKYRPGTYIQSAGGCWHGKCTFCVEKDKPYEVRPVEDVIDEIKKCKKFGFKEIFDDSATFPTGGWLDEFVGKLLQFRNSIRFSCNMRMVDIDYSWLRKVGFRMLLFGLESANQKTLNKINKEVKVEDYKYIIKAAKANLEPHLAVIFGYPWETDEEALNTLRLVHYLLKKGYAKTAQASFYTPPEGGGNETQRKYVKKIYEVYYSPTFWLNKLRDIHDIADLKYLWRQMKAGMEAICQKPLL